MIFWRVGNYEDAKDLTQDVFYRVYKNLHKFRGDSSIDTWIFKIALNRVKSFLWKQRFLRKSVSWESLDPEKIEFSEEFDSPLRMEHIVLRKEIERLPKVFKEVVLLKYFDGFDLKEISDILGVPVGTVKSRLSRARKILRKKLEKILK